MTPHRSLLAACALLAAVAIAPAANAGDAYIHVHTPGPVYAPYAYVPPARPVAVRRTTVVGPRCVWRTTRVWVGNHWASRRVRVCR